MKIKFYNNKILEINTGLLIEGEFSGKSSIYNSFDVKEIEIDGIWKSNPGYDLQKVKSQKLLSIETRLLEIYKDKQICENNNLKEKFDKLVIEQKKLESEKEEINAL